MALGSLFTGGYYKNANQATQGALGNLTSQAGGIAGRNFTGGAEALTGYGGLGAGAISGYTGAGVNALQGATPQQIEAYNNYLNQGINSSRNFTGSAANALQGYGAQAYNPVIGAANEFMNRGNTYGNATLAALGLGPEGSAESARKIFENTPGFKSALSIGEEGVLRNANASGLGASGNMIRGTDEYAVNAANQNYNNYISQLRGGEQLYNPLAAQGYATAANIAQNTGQGLAGLYSGQGGRELSAYGAAASAVPGYIGQNAQGIAGLYGQGGQALANMYGQTGQGLAGLYGQNTTANLGFLGQTINPTVQGYWQQAAGQQAGALAGYNLFGQALKAAAA